MNLQLSPKEEFVILNALNHLKNTKLKDKITQLSEYDIISGEHSIMTAVALMAKMTKKPPQTFMSPLQKTETEPTETEQPIPTNEPVEEN